MEDKSINDLKTKMVKHLVAGTLLESLTVYELCALVKSVVSYENGMKSLYILLSAFLSGIYATKFMNNTVEDFFRLYEVKEQDKRILKR